MYKQNMFIQTETIRVQKHLECSLDQWGFQDRWWFPKPIGYRSIPYLEDLWNHNALEKWLYIKI